MKKKSSLRKPGKSRSLEIVWPKEIPQENIDQFILYLLNSSKEEIIKLLQKVRKKRNSN
jgi:hypothetical protein